MRTSALFVMAVAGLVLAGAAAAQDGNGIKPENEPPKTEEAPGYSDFENGDLSAGDIKEAEERRDDRNIVSPGMRDEQELEREMGQD